MKATQSAAGISLRGHQEEVLEAIVRGLTPRPGYQAPNGLRVTVQMATGSGKSYVGAAAGQKLVPRGTVLVVVPTLDLLVQMVGAWRAAGRSGDMHAICSLVDSELPFGVMASTSPLMIGMWLANAAKHRRPITLFATYTSVGAVADAYEYWAERQGELLPPLGLMVCDEAHRSSGSVEKTWTVVHDQAAIPADRRLYMTATPRIWAPPKRPVKGREGAYQPLPEELAVSMDDQRIYGPHVYSLGLAEAIDRRLLAPFEIVVLELRDPLGDRAAAEAQGVPWGPGVGEAEDGSEDEVPAARIAAIQAGLVKTVVERDLRRCITFHSRTIEVRYFSETLNQTVEKLHFENPQKYPPEFWAQWLSGEHDVDYRKELIGDFGKGEEDDGLRYRIFSNCKVLGEGVDMPNADSVLLQGRGSMVDIVQAIGRALRMQPGEGKTASLIVPVFLKPGEEPGDILESDSYGPLVKILTALRSHDAKVVEALAVPQKSGKRTKGRSAEAASGPGESMVGAGGGSGAFTLPVRFQTPVDENVLALFIASRVLVGETQLWREGIGHARKWFEETGGLDVPYSAMVGENRNYPLGKWLSDRRGENAAGELASYRVEMLDALGMIWSVSDARFEAGLDWARVWAKGHGGSLAAPARASVGGYAIGTWLSELRAAAQVPDGEQGALAPERRRALEEIDPWWAPRWPITWQRSYATARSWWLESDGRVDWAALPVETEFEGEALGRWVQAQRAGFGELDQEQRDLLSALGVEEDQELAAVRAKVAARPNKSRGDRFAAGLAALAAFVAEHGHARPARTHKTADGLALGVWVNNQRARRDKLSEEQRGQLEALGVVWG
ncbi:Helicase associated domain protein [Streptomyces sp. BE20]|uniref:DEAD/DEAH box helicase n=1 Tax=Streptomyces sp. BE20 TaxID=3002525 RepID=UPI002E7779AE|nr:Helicase associated domain protein [Streptomyces sp. BE20]MEE1826162.1 Helicase associated domain protein [Streptomyces sp. BE20]